MEKVQCFVPQTLYSSTFIPHCSEKQLQLYENPDINIKFNAIVME